MNEDDEKEVRSSNSDKIKSLITADSNNNDLYFYSKSNIKLIELKEELSKEYDEDLYIFDNYLINKNGDFKISIENNEMVLDANLSQNYFKIRKILNTKMYLNK